VVAEQFGVDVEAGELRDRSCGPRATVRRWVASALAASVRCV